MHCHEAIHSQHPFLFSVTVVVKKFKPLKFETTGSAKLLIQTFKLQFKFFKIYWRKIINIQLSKQVIIFLVFEKLTNLIELICSHFDYFKFLYSI